MDHLLLPQDPTKIDNRVPYVCKEPYDSPSFFGYPLERESTKHLPTDPDLKSLLAFRVREKHHPTPVRQQEAIFQGWLFFGILKAFLRQIYSEHDFLDVDESGTWVHTRNLFAKLGQSWSQGGQIDLEHKKLRYKLAAKCLHLANNVLTLTHRDFDWRIKLSIGSLCEVLSHATNEAFVRSGVATERLCLGFWGNSLLEQQRTTLMLEAGWCPSEILRSKARFRSAQALSLLCRMKPAESLRDHRDCTETLCKRYQINREDYEPRHLEGGCQCESVAVKNEDVVPIYESGRLPLLKLVRSGEGQNNISVEVLESSPETPYVAISHAWANGLGNIKETSLPGCQLAHIWNLVQRLHETAIEETVFQKKFDVNVFDSGTHQSYSGPLYIWIDTMCCPVAPEEAKNLSLKFMQETYQQATHVLVLDSALQSFVSSTLHTTEICLRIFTTGWMQRLWTLQEGVLAKRLWFQFKDLALDFLSLRIKMTRDKYTYIPYIPLALDLTASFEALQWQSSWNKRSDGIFKHTIGHRLYMIDDTISERSVTFASDEALCLATLLRLKPDRVVAAGQRAEQRMTELWRVIAEEYGGIPQGVIGLQFPKLRTPGFRWAPRTLLHEHRSWTVGGSRKVRYSSDELASITEKGLRVVLNGFCFYMASACALSAATHYRAFGFMIGTPAVQVEPNGRFYRLVSTDVEMDEAIKAKRAPEEFALPIGTFLFEGNCAAVSTGAFSSSTDFLFGSITTDADGAIELHNITSVLVFEIREAQEYLWRRSELLAQELRPEYDRHMKEMMDIETKAAFNQEKAALSLEPSAEVKEAALVLDRMFTDCADRLREKVRERALLECEDEKLVESVAVIAGTRDSVRGLWVLVMDRLGYGLSARPTGQGQVWYID